VCVIFYKHDMHFEAVRVEEQEELEDVVEVLLNPEDEVADVIAVIDAKGEEPEDPLPETLQRNDPPPLYKPPYERLSSVTMQEFMAPLSWEKWPSSAARSQSSLPVRPSTPDVSPSPAPKRRRGAGALGQPSLKEAMRRGGAHMPPAPPPPPPPEPMTRGEKAAATRRRNDYDKAIEILWPADKRKV
jgi:hypothetical protein